MAVFHQEEYKYGEEFDLFVYRHPLVSCYHPTCGGLNAFVRDFKRWFLENDSPSSFLINELKGYIHFLVPDIRPGMPDYVSSEQHAMAYVMSRLDQPTFDDIVESWCRIVETCPLGGAAKALSILHLTLFNESLYAHQPDLPPHLLQVLAKAAEEFILPRPEYRARLAHALVLSSQRLNPAVAEDVAVIKAQEEAHQRNREYHEEVRQRRLEHMDHLSSMPFPQRMITLHTDKSMPPDKWRPEWTRCPDIELEGISYQTVQKLIDVCEAHSKRFQDGTLRRLYDLRHTMRTGIMAETRSRHVGKLPWESLSMLLDDPLVPIEHYPDELAREVAETLRPHLSLEQAKRLELLMTKTRLRAWKMALSRWRSPSELER